MDTSPILDIDVLHNLCTTMDLRAVFELETAELPQINIDVLMIVYVGIEIDVYIIIVITDRLQASPYRKKIDIEQR
jgi:hypothetical protein